MYRDLSCQHHLAQEQDDENQTFLASHRSEMGDASHPSAEEEYKRLWKSPVRIYQSAIQTKRKGFQSKSLGDCSPNMRIIELVRTSNVVFQSIECSRRSIERSLRFVGTPFIHRAPINKSATQRTIVLDASALFCLQILHPIAVSTSTSLCTDDMSVLTRTISGP